MSLPPAIFLLTFIHFVSTLNNETLAFIRRSPPIGMEAIISGLILASVTALAFIAYRHPKQYNYIAIPIVVVLFIVWLFITAWNGSSEMLSIKIERLLESNNNLESKNILKNHQYFSGYPITVIFLSIYAFLYLLLWLPEIGITHEKTKNSPKDPDNQKTK